MLDIVTYGDGAYILDYKHYCRRRAAILKLLASEDQTLLVCKSVLNFLFGIIDSVRILHRSDNKLFRELMNICILLHQRSMPL